MAAINVQYSLHNGTTMHLMQMDLHLHQAFQHIFQLPPQGSGGRPVARFILWSRCPSIVPISAWAMRGSSWVWHWAMRKDMWFFIKLCFIWTLIYTFLQIDYMYVVVQHVKRKSSERRKLYRTVAGGVIQVHLLFTVLFKILLTWRR